MTNVGLRQVLADVSAVIFDFDGPLCDVFAGSPAWVIARKQSELIGASSNIDDPLAVLREAQSISLEALSRLETGIVSAEIAAVAKSATVPGGMDSIRARLRGGRAVAVVSNNCHAALYNFFDDHGLLGKVDPLIGRTPNP